MSESNLYLNKLNAQSYAYGVPEVRGSIKATSLDFQVVEVMEVELSGEGEHFWLDISKTGLSSERVAKGLARHSGVAYRDVGYSGMKDVHAVTRQWFSVWMPKNLGFDWSDFVMDGVIVHTIGKHSRKLKRGTHKANKFCIRATQLQGDFDKLNATLSIISDHGVPNYFGEQRFGYSANNLVKAQSLFTEGRKIKDRQLKSIVLSSARSFLFNQVLSERIKRGDWDSLWLNEPASLNGSNAVFQTAGEPENEARLLALDIHPTAPMWGRGCAKESQNYAELADFEMTILGQYQPFLQGLEMHGLEYQRRATRSVVKELQYGFSGDVLELSFTLQKGQFATSVLREIIYQV